MVRTEFSNTHGENIENGSLKNERSEALKRMDGDITMSLHFCQPILTFF